MTAVAPEVVTLDGEDYYQWRTVLRIPKNWTPESGVFIAVAPPGGIANFPAAIEGAPGPAPVINNTTMTELAWNDPSPASVEWTLVGTLDGAPVYDVEFSLHKGAPGDAGDMTLLDATDLDDGGAPTAGYIFQVNAEGDGVELVALRVGNTYWPSTVATLSNATGANALAQVTIPGHDMKVRLHCNGQAVIDPDGPDVQVDLVARLGGTGTGTGATDGNVIARGFGLAGGATQVVVLSPSPPIGSATGFGEVAATASTTVVYFRAEQVGSGTDTFDTLSGRALFSVTVDPIA
ncbi:hypothetical protein [Mycolicibacterium gilvum]|uniref:hypothetical protein n=1 Tax=Mycolicibacterium gilvum TaxID=1804 RepID=UPI004046136D